LESISDFPIISFPLKILVTKKATFVFTKMHVIGAHAYLNFLPSNISQENLPCLVVHVPLLFSFEFKVFLATL
jgi:hypothetical protein